MPRFGYGTYKVEKAETMKRAVIDHGYRMFDCASFYKNEAEVGKALTDLIVTDKSVKREEMFIISKVWWDEVDDV